MGIVFRATHEDGREVALKVLREELAGDETFRRRFDHEARSASHVRSPHLVAVLDAGEAGGRYYLASEFVAGATLGSASAAAGRCRSPTRSRSRPSSRPPSTRSTRRASSTATSRPRTCSCATAGRRC
jgi:serine/threonine-protein kinase